MKFHNKIITMGVAAVATLSMASCSDFLDEPSRTQLPEEKIYGNVETAETSLLALSLIHI